MAHLDELAWSRSAGVMTRWPRCGIARRRRRHVPGRAARDRDDGLVRHPGGDRGSVGVGRRPGDAVTIGVRRRRLGPADRAVRRRLHGRITVRQRAEIGRFRMIGAPPRQARRLVLAEACPRHRRRRPRRAPAVPAAPGARDAARRRHRRAGRRVRRRRAVVAATPCSSCWSRWPPPPRAAGRAGAPPSRPPRGPGQRPDALVAADRRRRAARLRRWHGGRHHRRHRRRLRPLRRDADLRLRLHPGRRRPCAPGSLLLRLPPGRPSDPERSARPATWRRTTPPAAATCSPACWRRSSCWSGRHRHVS